VPLLADDLLPAWATPPVRTFLAVVDGLLDAVPGIVVMTATTLLSPDSPGFSSGVSGLDLLLDQPLGGGALLAVAESVGLPVIAAVFLEWVRSDERDARASDLLEDETSRAATAQPHHETSPDRRCRRRRRGHAGVPGRGRLRPVVGAGPASGRTLPSGRLDRRRRGRPCPVTPAGRANGPPPPMG